MRIVKFREFDFPDPEVDQQLDAFLKMTAERKLQYENLVDLGFKPQAQRLILLTAHEQIDRMYTIGRTAGLFAIAQGELTQVAVARQLNYHPATVHSWVNQARANPQLNRDYSVDYLKIERKARDV